MLIIELKTEGGSYQPRQMADYLRLARHKLPDSWTDLVLLGPHRPAATPAHDDRQRYAELTWGMCPTQPEADEVDDAARGDAAVTHALRLAPSVAMAYAGDRTERGIDVQFPSMESARRAQRRVMAALDGTGWTDRVSVWLWQPSSTGKPATDAGAATGRELRLAPKSPHRASTAAP